MRCDEVRDLIALRPVGMLEPHEEALVRRHLEAGCPSCAGELAAAAESFDLLPFGLPEAEPSPMAKARLMEAIRKEGPTRRMDSPAGPRPAVSRSGWRMATAASLAAAIGTGALTTALLLRRQEAIVSSLEAKNAELVAQVARQSEELASLGRQMQQARQSIQLVSSPGVMVANLAGQADRADVSARVFWDRTSAVWQLYASNLPAAPAGRTYQLWVITDAGRMISAGTFEEAVKAAATGLVSVPPDAGRPKLAGVTLEPAGGSPQPTTQPFLVGTL